MVDKLTKKRLKVDYFTIIRIAGLQDAFLSYLNKKQSKISMNRKAQAFCRSKKLDIAYYMQLIEDEHIVSEEDYFNYCVRIAHVKWLDED